MAVYTLDSTNRSTLFSSFIAALQNAGVYGGTLNQTASDLYFTLAPSRSALYYRLTYGSDTDKRPALYYGTGYSGGSLVNQRTVLSIGDHSWSSHWVVVGPVTIGYLAKSTGSAHLCWFVGDFGSSETEVVGGCSSATSSLTAAVYWTATHSASFISSLSVRGVASAVKNESGSHYMKMPPVLLDSSFRILATTAGDLFLLCREPSFVAGLEVYGDDVVLCGGTVGQPSPYTVLPFYIAGGYSWRPG